MTTITTEMLSIRQAAKNGIDKLRRPIWALREDHIQIDLFENGKFGPWVHIYSPVNDQINGKNPVDVLITEFDVDAVEWEAL